MFKLDCLIAPFIDIPMFNIKYLAIQQVRIHAGAIRKLLYGFASVQLKLVDYLHTITKLQIIELQKLLFSKSILA